MENLGSKLNALNTIALWILVLIVGGWLIFKPDNTLNKDTVTRLADVVDKLGVASENMNKLANSQRDWYANIQQAAATGAVQRNNDYNDLYGKYGYENDEGTSLSLNDLYDHRLRTQTEHLGSGHVRGGENTDSKNGSVQKPASESKG